jgi:preprotein translocase subunit SecA
MFQNLLVRLGEEITIRLAHVEPQSAEVDVLKRKEEEVKKLAKLSVEPQVGGDNVRKMAVKPEERDPANPETWGRVGRNEICPCGSGKKYKQCHGKLA